MEYIISIRTNAGLEVICVRDDTEYQLAKKVSDADFDASLIVRIHLFESWNYKILPHQNHHYYCLTVPYNGP
jgi:hypothetical protein